VHAGELVLLDNRAANHDPSVFPSSGRVDIARQGPAHLSFGHGAHYCLGAPLARLEAQITFETVLRRLSDIELAVPVGQLTYRPAALMHGLESLPIRFSLR